MVWRTASSRVRWGREKKVIGTGQKSTDRRNLAGRRKKGEKKVRHVRGMNPNNGEMSGADGERRGRRKAYDSAGKRETSTHHSGSAFHQE